MKRKTRYSDDMPSNRARIIKDFLPPPNKIILPNKNVKITIMINQPIIDFFKAEAKRYGTKYQRMVREVLKRYAELHGR